MSSTVLAEVDWDGGFAIPVANAANKALQEEVMWKEKEKIRVENELERLKDKKQALSDHLKNAIQELPRTEGLCQAKESETASEKHLKALSEREAGCLHKELARVERELGLLKEKKSSEENDMSKASQKLEELRSQLNWDQQTLDGWLEESALRDEDTMALVKFSQQDERRIKSLTLAIEKKTVEANQRRKALDNELTETVSAQIALDKSAENFRQAHQERQELLRQWENTIKQMKRRDTEMQQCTLQLAEVNQEGRARCAAVREKRDFLQTEEHNNRECERRISRAERQASELRQDLQEQELHPGQCEDHCGQNGNGRGVASDTDHQCEGRNPEQDSQTVQGRAPKCRSRGQAEQGDPDGPQRGGESPAVGPAAQRRGPGHQGAGHAAAAPPRGAVWPEAESAGTQEQGEGPDSPDTGEQGSPGQPQRTHGQAGPEPPQTAGDNLQPEHPDPAAGEQGGPSAGGGQHRGEAGTGAGDGPADQCPGAEDPDRPAAQHPAQGATGRHPLCEEGGRENWSREPRDDNQDGGAATVQRHLGQGAEEAQDDQAGHHGGGEHGEACAAAPEGPAVQQSGWRAVQGEEEAAAADGHEGAGGGDQSPPPDAGQGDEYRPEGETGAQCGGEPEAVQGRHDEEVL
ncbi:eukaryotic translation initiation factor 3 subunit A-like [Gadus macrocephalus]|uniref:eukaryotic translation initiation factor 3 subunit A-like n=1 Tax=Gadus macrocephalus TaxID=80720 RepID=UPI0028CBA4BE|nr:eukaryotic translation initiation factor 3 subunit A-like [Gadus macrocephalus]